MILRNPPTDGHGRSIRQHDVAPAHREAMARAVCLIMLTTDERWREWLPKADEIIAGLGAELGVTVAASDDGQHAREGT